MRKESPANHSYSHCLPLIPLGNLLQDDAFILCAESAQGKTPEDFLQIYQNDPTDERLAMVYADVSNKVGMLMHDINDPDFPEDVQRALDVAYHAWSALEEYLAARIIRIIQTTEAEWYAEWKAKKTGRYRLFVPFMKAHGFYDGSGWWVRKDLLPAKRDSIQKNP